MTLTCRKEQLATAARSYPDAAAVMEAGTLCTNDSATLLSLLARFERIFYGRGQQFWD